MPHVLFIPLLCGGLKKPVYIHQLSRSDSVVKGQGNSVPLRGLGIGVTRPLCGIQRDGNRKSQGALARLCEFPGSKPQAYPPFPLKRYKRANSYLFHIRASLMKSSVSGFKKSTAHCCALWIEKRFFCGNSVKSCRLISACFRCARRFSPASDRRSRAALRAFRTDRSSRSSRSCAAVRHARRLRPQPHRPSRR